MREAIHRLAVAVAAILAVFAFSAACGDSSSGKLDGGADARLQGSGGRISTGGTTGVAGTGGILGSGGRAIGSGGSTRIDAGLGTGGLPGSGGRATGGATGTGGGTGGTVGIDAGSSDGARDQATADVRADASRDGEIDSHPDVGADAPVDAPLTTDSAPQDGAGAGTLESCFAGLPAPVGAQMIATKSTTDGRIRMRIALDTEDRMGTSGTYGWGLIRLAVEVDGAVTCLKDRTLLVYTGSHHNCDDNATATAGTTTYKIAAPDRPAATLTIMNAGATVGTYTLSDTACTMVWSAGAPITCRSGGGC